LPAHRRPSLRSVQGAGAGLDVATSDRIVIAEHVFGGISCRDGGLKRAAKILPGRPGSEPEIAVGAQHLPSSVGPARPPDSRFLVRRRCVRRDGVRIDGRDRGRKNQFRGWRNSQCCIGAYTTQTVDGLITEVLRHQPQLHRTAEGHEHAHDGDHKPLVFLQSCDYVCSASSLGRTASLVTAMRQPCDQELISSPPATLLTVSYDSGTNSRSGASAPSNWVLRTIRLSLHPVGYLKSSDLRHSGCVKSQTRPRAWGQRHMRATGGQVEVSDSDDVRVTSERTVEEHAPGASALRHDTQQVGGGCG